MINGISKIVHQGYEFGRMDVFGKSEHKRILETHLYFDSKGCERGQIFFDKVIKYLAELVLDPALNQDHLVVIGIRRERRWIVLLNFCLHRFGRKHYDRLEHNHCKGNEKN